MAYDDSAYRGGDGVEAKGSTSRYEEAGSASPYDDKAEGTSRFEDSGYRADAEYRADTGYRDDSRTDSRYDDSGYQGTSSYRDETSYRDTAYQDTTGASYRDSASYRNTGYSGGGVAGDYTDPEPYGPVRSPLSSAELDEVFDDPAHGERGRDRMLVHILWELVLIAAVAGVGYLLHREFPTAIRRPEADTLLVFATGLGLLALGAGLTLRAAVPNLALGPVAVASALHFAENGDQGVVPVVLVAAGAAAALGLAVAILVLGAHVPGWAGSLAAALAVIVFIQQRSEPVALQGGYDPTQHALYLFAGFVTLALIGATFGAVKAIRRAVGRLRPISDPADRRGGMAAALSGSAIVVSMTFAAVAGVLLAASSNAPVAPTSGLEWTGLAFGAALVAGTSAFGRRGGITGTIAAVALLVLVIRYTDLKGWNISLAAFAGGAVALGLLVTRLVERFGRPRPVRAEEKSSWETEYARPTWTTTRRERSESWSSVLPAQPTGERTDLWDSSRWASSGR